MQKIKISLVTVFLCFLSMFSFAQHEITIKGIIYKKSTAERVAEVLITNLNNHTVMMSNDLGVFTIKASLGDTLLISKVDYADQKQVVINDNDIAVYLQPVIHLSEVTIMGQTKKQEMDAIMKDYRSKGTFYAGKPPVLGSIKSPLTGLYELFGKTPGQARRFAAYEKKENEATEDHRKYNKELVMRITGLNAEDAQKFMDNYTPIHEDLVKWTEYDVITYIKKSLVSYKKYGAQPLQKLY